MGYTKLWSDIVTSSIWNEDAATRLMWVTFLAMADSTGFVSGSIPGMARIANLSLEDGEKAIQKLSSPDPYSRSKEFEGRRIEWIDGKGGWLILKYIDWRDRRSAEDRREYMRQYMQDRRDKETAGKQSKGEKKKSTDVPGEASGSNAMFKEFWEAYPRKVAKAAAYKAFVKLKPTQELVDAMLGAIAAQRQTEQWTKEEGKFIPHPATWLNQHRWEDEVSGKGSGYDGQGLPAEDCIQIEYECGYIPLEERDRRLKELRERGEYTPLDQLPNRTPEQEEMLRKWKSEKQWTPRDMKPV